MSRREYDNPAGGIWRYHPTLNWASNILAARSIPKGREGCRDCFPHSTPLDWLGSEWMETKPSQLTNSLPYYDSKWYLRRRF